MTRVKVGDLVAEGVLRVEDGNHGNDRPRPDEFVLEGVPFIRAADMTSGVVDFNGAGRINDVARRRIRKGAGAPGDVILSHKGTVGKIAVVPSDAPDFVCSPQTTLWRSLDPARLDQRYLRYAMHSADFQSQLDLLKGQTDMAPYVSLTDQRGMSLDLPDQSQQRAIAEVLGALDDKIAANANLSATVVLLADAEFARLARLSVADGRSFEDIAEVGGGGTPSTRDPALWNGDIAWATPTDVTALPAPYLSSTARTISADGLAACASPLYPAGSILMTSRATIGAFAVAERGTAVNQGFIVVNARQPRWQWWLFHQMRARVPEFLNYANGATFLELSRGRFRQLPVWATDDAVMAAFNDLADSSHRRASAAIRESAQLARLREALLPELMSGRLRVRDAERIVEVEV